MMTWAEATPLIQVTVSGLLVGCMYGLLSVGLTLIFGLMEIVNFAHGEFLMLSMYGAFWAALLVGLDPLLSMPILVVVFFVGGVLTYRLLVKRVLGKAMLAQIMVTYGLAIFIRGLVQYLWTPNVRMIENPIVSGRIGIMGIYIGLPQLVASLGALAAFALLYLFITKTDTGLALRGTAQDVQVAKLMGINTDWMFSLGWGVSIGLLGVAGPLLANYLYVHPTVGFNLALIAYFAVAMGGFGSVKGALVGGVVIGLIEHWAAWYISPSLKWVVVFTAYLVLISFRPTGFFGKF